MALGRIAGRDCEFSRLIGKIVVGPPKKRQKLITELRANETEKQLLGFPL
jgi:hypothetical protein